jgi:hypothetical protein
MLDYVNDDQFLRYKYQKVYLPTIITVPLDKLEHYVYIKTVDRGAGLGHIISGFNVYYLCLRNDKTIRVDEAIYEPMGFRRKTIEECEKLAKTFKDAYEYNKLYGKAPRERILRTNLKKVVYPADLNGSLMRNARMDGKYLINTKTAEQVHLALHMADILRATGLKNYNQVDTVVNCGYEMMDWCYMGQRIDGKTWDEHFNSLQSVG